MYLALLQALSLEASAVIQACHQSLSIFRRYLSYYPSFCSTNVLGWYPDPAENS